MSLRKSVIQLKEIDDSSDQALYEAIRRFRATHPAVDSVMKQSNTINVCIRCMNHLAKTINLHTPASSDDAIQAILAYFGIDMDQYNEESRELDVLLKEYNDEPKKDAT